MVRMRDLPSTKRDAMLNYPVPQFTTNPSVRGPVLSQRRIALISTAALIRRGERPLTPFDTRYRTIGHGLESNNIVMSHTSVNFDRIGFQRDLNVVLPRDRLSELARMGVIGEVSDEHYSFMGSTTAEKLEPAARRLAARLHQRGVDSVLLVPI